MSDTKTPAPVHPLLEGTTPGPWTVTKNGYPNGIIDAQERIVAGAAMDNGYYDPKPGEPPAIGPSEASANAKLIAMAPTLAAENARLRAALELVSQLPGFEPLEPYGIEVLEVIASLTT